MPVSFGSINIPSEAQFFLAFCLSANYVCGKDEAYRKNKQLLKMKCH